MEKNSMYAPKEENKIEQLNQCVTQRGSIISILAGIISSLAFGIGMCALYFGTIILWQAL